MSALTLEIRRAGTRLDPVLAALATVFALLALVAPQQAEASLAFLLGSLWRIAPFLLGSVALAAYAAASGADNLIARVFRGSLAAVVPLGAVIGALSPFCSCGVIPLIAAMLAVGVPLPAVMAFWLASPLMDPSMFVLTAGTLGAGFAVAKTVAAIGIGLLGGYGTLLLMRAGAFAEPLRRGIGNGGCAGAKIRNPREVVWAFWSEEGRRATFVRKAADNLLFLGKWLALAFLLESLMLAWLPQEAVAGAVGGGGIGSILLAAAVGVPAYLNGYAALPLVGGLIAQGMAPGAGMAFLVGGGVTSVPAAMAVFALTRTPVFLAYFGFAMLGAVLSGLAWQAWAIG